jgi:DNA-binding MarR family transcriptional regulator
MKKPHLRLYHKWVKSDDYTSISGDAIKLYVLMMSYAKPPDGVCWPSQETLSKRTGFSTSKIHRLLDELKKHELVSKEVHGRGRVNNYFVQLDATMPITTDR